MLGWLNALQLFRKHYTKEHISFNRQEEEARADRKSATCQSDTHL